MPASRAPRVHQHLEIRRMGKGRPRRGFGSWRCNQQRVTWYLFQMALKAQAQIWAQSCWFLRTNVREWQTHLAGLSQLARDHQDDVTRRRSSKYDLEGIGYHRQKYSSEGCGSNLHPEAQCQGKGILLSQEEKPRLNPRLVGNQLSWSKEQAKLHADASQSAERRRDDPNRGASCRHSYSEYGERAGTEYSPSQLLWRALWDLWLPNLGFVESIVAKAPWLLHCYLEEEEQPSPKLQRGSRRVRRWEPISNFPWIDRQALFYRQVFVTEPCFKLFKHT